ncbi:MAG: ABC transporter permease [Ilumatobacteraceae bacterium]
MTSQVWLISRREVLGRVRRRSFLVFTLALCATIIGGGLLYALVSNDSRPSHDVGVVSGEEQTVALSSTFAAVGSAIDVDVEVVAVADRDEAEAMLDSGAVDVVLVVDDGTALWNTGVDVGLSRLVDTAWVAWSAADAAAEAGLEPVQIEAILSPSPLANDVLDPDDDDLLGVLVGFASAMLLFVSVTMFGGYVLTGVVEEKSTGVIEVLLSHVSAQQLMAGKVFGIGVVALIQFTAAVLAGLVSLAISGLDVPSEIWVGLPVAVVWFIGGFLLYSTLFALAGSFVSRVEDAQGAAAPITAAITAAYILVFTFGTDPTSPAARVLSVLPPFAPLLMPLRMVTGAASMVEIIVAALLLAASVYGVIRLAGSVYSRTLLHRGSRITWRDALRPQPDGAAPVS